VEAFARELETHLAPEPEMETEICACVTRLAGVRVFRAREALKKRVMESCGTCAEHGCLNCTCQATA
jgi:RNA polymerase sigma-70 factor (ECF subfamily)